MRVDIGGCWCGSWDGGWRRRCLGRLHEYLVARLVTQWVGKSGRLSAALWLFVAANLKGIGD